MNKRILLIDDDEGILDAATMVLRNAGYVVEIASRGIEVSKKINEHIPDLILLDVLLSGEDGREICKKLKQDKKTNRIPIIMISALPSASGKKTLYGPDDFLAKPFEVSEFLGRIKKLIRSS